MTARRNLICPDCERKGVSRRETREESFVCRYCDFSALAAAMAEAAMSEDLHRHALVAQWNAALDAVNRALDSRYYHDYNELRGANGGRLLMTEDQRFLDGIDVAMGVVEALRKPSHDEGGVT